MIPKIKAVFTIVVIVVSISCSPGSESQQVDISTEELLSKAEAKHPDSSGFFSVKEYEEIQETTKILYERDISQDQLTQLYQTEVDLLSYSGDPIRPSVAALIDTAKIFQRCITSDASPDTVQKTFQFKDLRLLPRPNITYTIPLAFHIIKRSAQDDVSDSELRIQVDSLNRSYRSARIQFTIQHICRKLNSAWSGCFPTDKHPPTNNAFVAMTNQLSIDHMSAINIFINNLPALGIATFPWDATRHNTKQDVILINPISLPGQSMQVGGAQFVMEGNTLIHELGHFLGLFHTFHFESLVEYACDDLTNYDGCSIGDDVSDTPPQRICHFNGCGQCEGQLGCDPCQTASTCDTCSDNGDDPVENYMGYNPDTCMKKFSRGQYSRITAMLHSSAHRRHLITPVVPPLTP